MTKEQKIQEAYGKHWETVKDFVNMDDGSCCGVEYKGYNQINNHPSLNEMGIYQEDNFAKSWYDPHQNKHFWRPITLEKIETNNGWIKIESEEDLPRVGQLEAYYVVMKKDNSVHVAYFNSLTHKIQWLENISHYQPIIHPKPPIY